MINCRFFMFPAGNDRIHVVFKADQTAIGKGQYSRKPGETDESFVARVEKAAELDLVARLAAGPDIASRILEDLCEKANSRQRE